MVLMAAAADDDHDRHRLANDASSPPAPAPLPPQPQPQPPHRRRLHSFSFPTLSWGTHRLLRCSKNPASSPPPAAPGTPSPDKEKALPSADGAAGGGSPQRPLNGPGTSAPAAPPPSPRARPYRTTRPRLRGACVGAPRGGQQAGVFHRALQGGDRRRLCVVPRDASPAPAQEAPSHRAAPDRLAVPRILPSGCDAGNVQDRGEVIANMVEIHIIRWEGVQMCLALFVFR